MPTDLLAQAHHDGAALHVPDDAPAPGETVPVFVRVPRGDGARNLWVRTIPDAEPKFVAGTIDRETEHESWWRCDVEVRTPLTSYRFLSDGGPTGYRWLNGTGVHAHDVTDASDFRICAYAPPPQWSRDAIVYQVFPDRFARSAAADGRALPAWAEPAEWDDPVVYLGHRAAAQVYGGDLEGIAEHLDHVAAVGANTVYLTPFFPAESNHRYNASSFDEVDPLLGGDKALERLAHAVHARGWHLVGDLTANHSGDTHPWFQRALADPTSVEREFYYFAGPDSDAYEGWLGVATLPKFRHRSAELRRRLLEGPGSVAAKWLRPPYDLDGWRVDVANMTGRQAEDDFNHEVARALRTTMLATRPDSLLLAEHCHDASGDLRGDGWHAAMYYGGFTRPLWAWLGRPSEGVSYLGLPVDIPRLGGAAFLTTFRAFAAALPWRSLVPSWALLGSHDSARIRTVTGDPDLVHVAAGLLFTLPPAPMIFAGDEIGMEGVRGEDARRPFPWHRRQTWHRPTLDRYAALAALRTSSDALRRGGLRWVHADDESLTFLRESGEQRLLVHAARATHVPVRLPAPGLGLVGEAPNVYGGAPALRAGAEPHVTLPGDGPTIQIWQLA